MTWERQCWRTVPHPPHGWMPGHGQGPFQCHGVWEDFPEESKAEELVHVGFYCWRGGTADQPGHLAAMACRSDSVPIYVPKEREKDMRGVMDDE